MSPKPAPRTILPANQPATSEHRLVLGLDPQGGSYLLVEVDNKAVSKEMVESLRDDVRRILHEAHVGYLGLETRNGAVEVRIR